MLEKEPLRTRVLDTVERTVAEFHSEYRRGTHYGWKEPGPATWDMWTIIDILREMKHPPEDEELRTRIKEVSKRITDLVIERTRNNRSRPLISAEAQTTAEILYRTDIKELENRD